MGREQFSCWIQVRNCLAWHVTLKHNQTLSVCLFILILLCSFFPIEASSVAQQASIVRTHSDLQVGDYMSDDMTSRPEEIWNRDMIENQVWLYVFHSKCLWMYSYNCWRVWWGVIVQSLFCDVLPSSSLFLSIMSVLSGAGHDVPHLPACIKKWSLATIKNQPAGFWRMPPCHHRPPLSGNNEGEIAVFYSIERVLWNHICQCKERDDRGLI